MTYDLPELPRHYRWKIVRASRFSTADVELRLQKGRLGFWWTKGDWPIFEDIWGTFNRAIEHAASECFRKHNPNTPKPTHLGVVS